MCACFLSASDPPPRTLTDPSSLLMEAGKLGLGGMGLSHSPSSPIFSSCPSSPIFSSSPPSLSQSHKQLSSDEDYDDEEDGNITLQPITIVPRLDTRRMRITIKTDRPNLVSGSLDTYQAHLAHIVKFKKSRRAHSIATSKAELVLGKELKDLQGTSTNSSCIPNLPTHLSVANMRSSLNAIHQQQQVHVRPKRAFSLPIFHSWDHGFTDDVFAAEYDTSPAVSVREYWEEVSSDSRPTTPTYADHDLPLGERRIPKDPFASPSPLCEEGLPLGEKKVPQDIIFRTGDSKSFVVAGTLSKLVHYLASEELPDTNYIKMFILTFHRFMSSVDLLNMLITNFKNPTTIREAPKDEYQLQSIRRLIKSRIHAAVIFASFTADLQSSTEEKTFSKSLTAAMLTDGRSPISPPTSPTGAITPTKLMGVFPKTKHVLITKVEQFLDANPKEFAKQLTLIDQEMMKSINPRDLMERSRDKTKVSPLIEISKRFDQVSAWVTSEVVSTAHHKQRVLVITNFVHVIEELIRLNNFHSAMSVYLGLGATPCARLKETWKSLSRKILEKWAALEHFMSPSYNFKKLRAAIAHAPRPIIPPLTVIVKDLTFMEENSELYPADPRLINFEKIALIGQLLVDIHECGVTNYNLEVIS